MLSQVPRPDNDPNDEYAVLPKHQWLEPIRLAHMVIGSGSRKASSNSRVTEHAESYSGVFLLDR